MAYGSVGSAVLVRFFCLAFRVSGTFYFGALILRTGFWGLL